MLARFPNIEPSYDKPIHKKIQADFYTVIPKGDKAFLWFTYTGNKNACFVKRRREIKLYTSCFDDRLSLGVGTIISGVYFHIKGRPHFACTDIHYHEGEHVGDISFHNRLMKLALVFQSQIKKIKLENVLNIGVIPMSSRYEEVVQWARHVPYHVYGIGYRRSDGRSLGIEMLKGTVVREGVFRVRASYTDDVYYLSYQGDGGTPLVAAIPSYKRSVEMNSIFRNIKENRNLDALEESDDEVDFEDIRREKYVDLKKNVLMRCVYHKKFNKWEPVEVVKGRTAIICAKELTQKANSVSF